MFSLQRHLPAKVGQRLSRDVWLLEAVLHAIAKLADQCGAILKQDALIELLELGYSLLVSQCVKLCERFSLLDDYR